jgi:dienelactone hydrolase
MSVRLTFFLFSLALVATGLSARAEPVIGVTPAQVVEGEPVHIVVTGLAPGQSVTLRASQTLPGYPGGEQLFRGAASFVADAGGVIDLRTARPLAGSSYDRPDAAGLFWSMAPERKAGAGAAGTAPGGTEGTAIGDVAIEVESGGAVIARGVARIRGAAADVAVRDISEPGVTGIFARDRGAARQPAIIVLGGSEGGLATARWATPLLASQGYAVLGLGYFQGDEAALTDLPANLESIPLETLTRARDWLARQPGVDATRIAIVGVSKGAELALVGAATFPWVTAVGAFAPSHVVWEGVPPDDADRPGRSSWTLGGRPLPHVRWSWAAMRRGDAVRAATGSSRLTQVHLESLAEYAGDVDAARIPIERSRAALFIAAGTDDAMWPSAFSAEELRARLAKRDAALATVFEIHPTGHLIMGTGWAPTTQFQRATGRLQGGNARLDAEAQRVIWPAFLGFLDRSLRGGAM